MKYLVLIAILAVVYLVWKHQRQAGMREPRRDAAPPPAPGAAPQAMVACARCGLHLPRGDALADARGQHFCSAAHRDAGPGA